ncbi:hypothetical protein CPT_Slocum_088 [Serratia phage Slocum]|nr:hypothetical protein CPT_Slocum_088 [Serratia phage Slocum]
MTKVINIKSGEEYDVYIGRDGKGQTSEFGNPFASLSRLKSIEMYEKYLRARLESDPGLKWRLLRLRGQTLGCFCKPQPCHGDVIIKLIEELNC